MVEGSYKNVDCELMWGLLLISLHKLWNSGVIIANDDAYYNEASVVGNMYNISLYRWTPIDALFFYQSID
jgi:hypothetical protein